MIETVTGKDSANILLGHLELREITGTARRVRPAPGGAVANNVLVDGEAGGLRGLPFLRRLAG